MKLELKIADFLGLIFLGYLFSFQRNYVIRSGFLIVTWNFIGTVLHELSHFIVALILNGKPSLPHLIPKKEIVSKDGEEYVEWILGYVTVKNPNPFNNFFTGLAPILILVPLAFYVYLHFFDYFKHSVPNIFLYYLTIYLLLYNSRPSDEDIKIALKGYLGFLTTVIIIALLIYLEKKLGLKTVFKPFAHYLKLLYLLFRAQCNC